jgi:heterodisulfide reductase subunit C
MTGPTLQQQVRILSEQEVELCYHCHKCTAGCPVAVEMEFGPDRVLRMIQLGQGARVLTSRDIWICASCETCGTRCPNEINIAAVMDALRIIAVSEGHPTPEKNAPLFHRLFLGLVRQFGRMHEASLMALFKVRTLDLTSDMDSGLRMFLKGKIPILPHRVKGMQDVKRIYRETGS